MRELQVESELLPLNTPASKIKEFGFKAVIISGGPGSVYADNAPEYDPNLFTLNLPILGEFGITLGYFGAFTEEQSVVIDQL